MTPSQNGRDVRPRRERPDRESALISDEPRVRQLLLAAKIPNRAPLDTAWCIAAFVETASGGRCLMSRHDHDPDHRCRAGGSSRVHRLCRCVCVVHYPDSAYSSASQRQAA
jgi:hypothetical protein